MTYLDKYPNCNGCPVEKYCGTVVSSIRLCHSLDDSIAEKERIHALTLSNEISEEEQAIEDRITMWENNTE